MCLLAIFFRVATDAALVVAQPRGIYARPGEPPHILDGTPRPVAGVDPQAGGTWFGVNAHGVVAAVTNRARANVPTQPRQPGPANPRTAWLHHRQASSGPGRAELWTGALRRLQSLLRRQ